MVEQVAEANGETVSYSYRPTVFGAFREFSLTKRGIDWAVGLRSGSIPFDHVRRLRVSYRPHGMQSRVGSTSESAPRKAVSTSSRAEIPICSGNFLISPARRSQPST